MAGLCFGAVACDRKPGVDAAPAESVAVAVADNTALAGARIDLADAALERASRDEAFALLVAALHADPASGEARERLEELLGETRWNLPEIQLGHEVPVARVDIGGDDTLWVSVGDPVGTTLRWDLPSLSLGAVLFPRPGETTRSMVVSPDGRYAVIERGKATLLCHADTLQPIRDIGPLPDFVTPAATVAFSADGLLLAHPEQLDGGGVVWRLRDCKSGEVVRSSDAGGDARPLAAFVDATALLVLRADGSLMRMPVSPVEEITSSAMEGEVRLHHALFSASGGSALVLQDVGAHEVPAVAFVSYGEETSSSLETPGLLDRDSWNPCGPSLWTGLLRDPEHPWVTTDERDLRIMSGNHAPVRGRSKLTAFALAGPRVVTGHEDGTVTVHRVLPPPEAGEGEWSTEGGIDPASLDALCACLAGCRYDAAGREFVWLDAEKRIEALGKVDRDAIRAVFPWFDFDPVFAVLDGYALQICKPEALLPMWDRLALGDPGGGSWPSIVEATAHLARTRWHQELAEAVDEMSPEGNPDATDNRWLAPRAVEKAFETSEDDRVRSAIANAGTHGPSAAKALELALESTRPEWIRLCVESAEDLPPSLRRLALSRIEWLDDRKADAIARWPDGVPDYDDLRMREDWEGWEQADFQPAFEVLRQCMFEVLDAIETPDDPDADQRREIAARLLDPATLRAVGKERYADACLKAALVFSAHTEDVPTTLRLAELARNFGADPAPCLRAEAMAFTALGEFEQARERWIALITEHPVESQLPGDYAEASYTSFENADPVQAMQILTTGMHRFPNDANFALRAGWVSLLTGNSERAYRFLTTGQRIGYPEEKTENALLLLAIAAARTGAWEDAAAYYEDLKRLDDDWLDPATIETLEWPEELKASLRQLAW